MSFKVKQKCVKCNVGKKETFHNVALNFLIVHYVAYTEINMLALIFSGKFDIMFSHRRKVLLYKSIEWLNNFYEVVVISELTAREHASKNRNNLG